MAGGESSFNISVYRGPLQSLLPMMQSNRLAFTTDGHMDDGTTIYKPVTSASPSPQPPSTYQGGGNLVAADGSSAPIAPNNLNVNIGETPKRKRGRPRKYGPDGIALSPSFPAASEPGSGMTNTTTSASTEAAKNPKGRPLGSGKKQQMGALGSAGTGFTPHIITIVAGEDVSSKIISFSQHGSHAICVLSASGAVSNVTLRQPASSGGIVTYEGRFEILSLSGSFLLSESGGQRSRTGGLSVSLAGPDGRVFGGGVAGLLLAASPVQVILGSFLPDQRKESQQTNQVDPISSVEKLATGGTAGAVAYGESSGVPGSPLTQSTSACNNSSQQGLTNISWKL